MELSMDRPFLARGREVGIGYAVSAFLSVSALIQYGPAGFVYTMAISASVMQGHFVTVAEVLRGRALYAYHPDPDIHQRNIAFLGGNLCISTEGEGPDDKHFACHAPAPKREKKKEACCP